MELSYGFDTATYKLGKPCKKGHLLEGTDKTLRYTGNGGCVECNRERKRNLSPEQRRRSIERDRKRYAQKKQELRDEARERMRRYRATTEGALKTRETTKRRKALMRGSTVTPVQAKEIRARFEQFRQCCAYCGQGLNLQIEHFIAVSNGGQHKISNIIPACSACNYSKRKYDPEHWYKKQNFYSDYKWRRILIALGLQNPVVARVLAELSEKTYA